MKRVKSTRPGRPWEHGDPIVLERNRRATLERLKDAIRGIPAYTKSPERGIPKTHKTTLGYFRWLEEGGYATAEQVDDIIIIYKWTGIEWQD